MIIKRLFKSFSHAFDGISHFIKIEENFKIQLLFAVAVLTLALYYKLDNFRIIILILVILLVLTLEMINSIIERILNLIEPGIHNDIRIIKNVMAGAVLIASLGAVLVGLLIFWPYIFK